MRKVSATVIYKDNAIYNLTVNHKGVLIPLVAYDETSVKHPYEKRTFQTMYKSVLGIMKENNFYCGYYEPNLVKHAAFRLLRRFHKP